MNTEVMFSSNSDDWSTPDEFYQLLNKEFNFDLDAAASDTNHKCDRYFTEKDDALKQEWHGSVWLNPPYSLIKEFVQKAYEESQKVYCKQVVLLIPARTDTKYFHDYVAYANEIRFLKGRLKFGNSKNSAPFPSAVVVFKNNENEEDNIYDFFNCNRIKFWDWRKDP